MPDFTCLRCGNPWTSRKPNPKKCPACQNPNWSTARSKRRPEEMPPGKSRAMRIHVSEIATYSEPPDLLPIPTEPLPVIISSSTVPIDERRRRAEALLRKLA